MQNEKKLELKSFVDHLTFSYQIKYPFTFIGTLK